MALAQIQFLISAAVSITAGSKTINITGNVDAYHVFNGTAVFIGNNPPVEAIKGTTPDGLGNSTITLDQAWPYADVNNSPLIAFNTVEGLSEAIRKANSATETTLVLLDSFEQLVDSTEPSINIVINGVVTPKVPYGYLANLVSSLATDAQNASDTLTSLQTNVSTLTNTVNTIQSDLDASKNAAATSETNAASSASAANTSKNAAATSETNAASSASAANTSKNAAATSETNAASSASAANTSKNAAATSETNAATSATSASTSKTNAASSASAANTSKNAAATSETNAASSASAASTSKNAAATSETNAANSASAASTSKNAAATSETNAASSASAAATSESNAEQYSLTAQNAAQSMTGGMYFAGEFDASSGLTPPTPSSGSAYYKIITRGTINSQVYEVGDNIIYNNISASWFWQDNSERFTSINGFTSGAVILSYSHVGAEAAFSKNTAFNKNFGTTAGTVAEGDHTHPAVTTSSIGAVPTSRTVNGKPLSANITLAKTDVGLGSVDNTSDANKPVSTAMNTALAAKVPTSRTVNGKALSSNVNLSAVDVGAEAAFNKNTAFNKNFGTAAGTVAEGNHSHPAVTTNSIGAVPTSRTVNGKSLSANITLAKADVGLGSVDNTSDANKPVSSAMTTALNAKVPTTRTVNGRALSSNVVLSAADVGAEAAFSKNNAFNKSFGTAAGSVAEGNHSHYLLLQNTGTSTISGSNKQCVEINKWDGSSPVYTLNEATFAVGSKAIVRKLYASTAMITVVTSSGLFYMPDGTSNNTVTMSGNMAIVASFHKTDSNNWIVSVGTN